MALNFNQLAMLQKLRSSVQTFRNNHPKFPLFLNAVSADALKEDTIIEINVTLSLIHISPNLPVLANLQCQLSYNEVLPFCWLPY